MNNFEILTELPILDLHAELNQMLKNGILEWSSEGQICLNCTEQNSSDFLEGCGSLGLDWRNKTTIIDESGNEKIIVPESKQPQREIDFAYICNTFRGTMFEHVYQELKKKYWCGRIRIMKSKPKTCLSWHVDYHERIHFPIKTQEGCFMVIEDEMCFLEPKKWWKTHTTVYHTAVNASREDRIHLVATVLGDAN